MADYSKVAVAFDFSIDRINPRTGIPLAFDYSIEGIKSYTSIPLAFDFVIEESPEIADDLFTVIANVLTQLNVKLNEIGAGAITSVSVPAHGTAVINGLFIDYTADAGYLGTDSFTYVSGGLTATVNLIVLDLHKAWRIVVSDNNGGPKVAIAEAKLLNGLVNVGANTGVSYETSFNSASEKGDKAFDDNVGTAWISANVTFINFDTVITWHSVDRNLQTKPYEGWNEGLGNVPENNTIVHHINIYDENDILIKTDSIPYVDTISQYSYTYTQAQEKLDSALARINNSLRIEIWVSRTDNFDLDGSGVAAHDIESWQRFDHRFNRI